VSPSTLRERLAGHIVAGYLAGSAPDLSEPDPDEVAELAVRLADALIARLHATPIRGRDCPSDPPYRGF
jgi:hypothetical protein